MSIITNYKTIQNNNEVDLGNIFSPITPLKYTYSYTDNPETIIWSPSSTNGLPLNAITDNIQTFTIALPQTITPGIYFMIIVVGFYNTAGSTESTLITLNCGVNNSNPLSSFNNISLTPTSTPSGPQVYYTNTAIVQINSNTTEINGSAYVYNYFTGGLRLNHLTIELIYNSNLPST